MLTGPSKKWLLAALVLLAVGIALLILPTYASYCDSAGNQDQYRCAPYEVTASILTLLEAHNALITAIATVFIGCFTYTLRKSTDNLFIATKASADAANLNAQAVINAERAHVYVVIKTHNVADLVDATAGLKYTPEVAATQIQPPMLAYTLKNYGKSPAIIEDVSHCIVVREDEGGSRTYEPFDRALEVIAAQEETWPPIGLQFDERPFTGEMAHAVGNHDLMVFFCSQATFMDAFNRRHVVTSDFLYAAGRFHLISRRETSEQIDESEQPAPPRTGFFGHPAQTGNAPS